MTWRLLARGRDIGRSVLYTAFSSFLYRLYLACFAPTFEQLVKAIKARRHGWARKGDQFASMRRPSAESGIS